MNRRTVLRNLGLIVGGAVLLPSCIHHDGKQYIQLKHIKLDGDQQALIAEISEAIIPKTTTPGAKDLNLPSFVLMMLDDCYPKAAQEAFVKGIADFNDAVKKKYDTSFTKLSMKDKEAFLIDLESSAKPKVATPKNQITTPKQIEQRRKPEKKPELIPIDAFYGTIKQQTLFGYTSSKFFMTKEIVYELVPGRWNAHFPAKKAVNA